MECPRCFHENIDGVDRCENCLAPLRDRDVPQAVDGLQRALMEDQVDSLASHHPVVVSPSTTVAEAVRLMKQHRTGCAVVVSSGAPEGIFSERDLLLNLIGTGKALDQIAIKDVMTRFPETVGAADSVRFAVNKMSVGGFRHIPVLKDGQVVGVLSAQGIIKLLAHTLSSKPAES
ncbi:MAG TPA: CBS domain-containing protein [Blastocatellia bacterium]|nr:CBS domain-containing protein [Blastocatellia bacterium]